MLRMPNWLYRHLARAYLKERRRRHLEAVRLLADQDRRIRSYYMWARFGHAMGHHWPNCPYRH